MNSFGEDYTEIAGTEGDAKEPVQIESEKISISSVERESILNFNDGEPTASFYTLNASWRRKLIGISEKFPEQVKVVKLDANSIEVLLPKRWITIRTPVQYSEETRQKMVERGKALAEARRTELAEQNK